MPGYVPTDGLVGWWPFSGNADDESGHGNNGAVNNAQPAPDRIGLNASAYSFNGIDASIVVGDPLDGILDMQGGPVSISVWISSAQTTLGSLVTKQDVSVPNSSGDYNLDLDEFGRARFAMGFGNGQGDARISVPLVNDGGWHHLVATYTPTSIDVFVDGILATSGSNAISAPLVLDDSERPLQFGIAMPSATPYEGLLDDIGIWNRALTQQEIAALYNAQVGPCVSATPVGFTGLASSYQTSDPSSTLVGTPEGGVFIGPGISGSTFDPAIAGEGTHSIIYTFVDGDQCVNSAGLCTAVSLGMGLEPVANVHCAVRIFPNPNHGQFTVELELSGLVSLQVFDARGRQVHNELFQASGVKTRRSLDLSRLAKGTYTIQVQNAGSAVSQQIVVE